MVLGHTFAFVVGAAEAELCRGQSLVSSLLVPADSFCMVLGHTFAEVVGNAMRSWASAFPWSAAFFHQRTASVWSWAHLCEVVGAAEAELCVCIPWSAAFFHQRTASVWSWGTPLPKG